jgi:integrase
MTPLRQALVDYLTLRRALGYKLKRAGKLLAQFIVYLEELGVDTLTTEHALSWATLPAGGNASWWSYRLCVVRGFAAHLHNIDPAVEVPATDLLPWRSCRATPYLYSEKEIAALIGAAETLRTPLRVATYQTLIGLLAVTGMRVGEAIRLDRDDVDSDHGLLAIRNSKFGKSRELPFHPSTVDALRRYVRRADRSRSATSTPAVLISTAGTRLLYCNVQCTFRQLVDRAGLRPRSASCRPRLHDLRHTFAVDSVLDGYRGHGDVEGRLELLSTYLGHVDPGSTYWYLSAAPELLELAARRVDRYLGNRS